MDRSYIDLYTLQTRVKTGMEALFPDRIWVKAEIAGLSRKPNGHCYLELSQSGPGGLVAKSRAVIWASRIGYVDAYFKSVTGASLDVGMEILARVQVSYHVLCGRPHTIDAVDQLLENEYGFVLHPVLFEATMQGETAPASIVSAIGEALSEKIRFDAILILRGGGSELDLSCFDDYDLAVAIARCPVPVFTAIGHDRDFHVADRVACVSVKTPTALADLFLDCYVSEDQRLGAYESRLRMAFTGRLATLSSRLDLLDARIARTLESRLSRAEHRINLLAVGIFQNFKTRLAEASHRVDMHAAGIFRGARSRITAAEHRLALLADRLPRTVTSRLDKAENRLARTDAGISLNVNKILSAQTSRLLVLESKIATTDPRGILRKGFVLALDRDGIKMHTALHSRVGDRVQMMFADGTLKCGVVEVDRRSNLDDGEAVFSARESG